MAELSFRIELDPAARVGPGKVRLMELIDRHGSIAEAARAMGMSYRRAWLLVLDLNRIFKDPLVRSTVGGRSGGGAELTPTGHEVVRRYHAVGEAASRAAAADLGALAAMAAPREGRPGPAPRARGHRKPKPD